ncbi:hypothetical protein SLUN_20480 [Streptomyces lunaelactis]|uniref:Uncharacterized protein n=1 Tax=Streptomyces lunaelactis TaxID=1535768 RepID=A0A2R4T526_9ACTN|nr:hypothetical protein SLUN_20480 [Streptomyces lunaelactis]
MAAAATGSGTASAPGSVVAAGSAAATGAGSPAVDLAGAAFGVAARLAARGLGSRAAAGSAP